MNHRFGEINILFNVKDLDRSERFYRDLMGLMVVRHHSEADGDWLSADVREGLVLIFFSGEEPIGRSPIVVFGLDEGGIDSVVETLAANGVEMVTPVSEAPGGWSTDFRDPDGHPLAFYQTDDLPRRR